MPLSCVIPLMFGFIIFTTISRQSQATVTENKFSQLEEGDLIVGDMIRTTMTRSSVYTVLQGQDFTCDIDNNPVFHNKHKVVNIVNIGMKDFYSSKKVTSSRAHLMISKLANSANLACVNLN